MNKILAVCITAIIVILILILMSQKVNSWTFGNNLIFNLSNQAKAYISAIYPKIADQVESGGEVIKNSFDQTQQNISDTGKNIENYFTGIKNAISGKDNCSVDK